MDLNALQLISLKNQVDQNTASLEEKANQSSLDSLQTTVTNIGNASPKGVYATVPLLQASFPSGTTGIYLVTGNVAEVASLAISAAPTSIGNVTVTLNGVATNVAVTSGVAEVASLTVTASCSSSGNVTVTLNGVETNVALDSGTDTTTDLVATKIRNTAFSGWTTGGAGSVVTFTASAVGVKTDASYSAGTTGATGTMTTTTQGVDADTTTTVATKIRNTAFSGWTTGGSGTTITFTCNATGVKTDSVYSAGSTGATGTMTTTTQGVDNDGKWYYWNGSTWTSGGTYQSTGVSDEAITTKKLSAEMQNDILDFIEVSTTKTTGSAWTISAGIVSMTSYGSADALSAIPVLEGEVYYVSLTGVNTALYDIILTPSIGGYFTSRYINDANAYTRYEVTIPAGVNYLLVNTATSTTAKIEKKEYVGIASKTYVEKSVDLTNDLYSEINSYKDVITSRVTGYAWAISAGIVSQTAYPSSDALGAIPVIEGEKYHISLTGVNTALYDIILTGAINDYFVSRYINDGNVYTDYEITIPAGVNYMLINTLKGTYTRVKKYGHYPYISQKENNYNDFSKLKFVCFGDSTVSDEITGGGRVINDVLGTELIANFAHGNAKCSDWYEGVTNETTITPNILTNSNTNENVLSNQIRKCIQNSTPSNTQTSWVDRLTMNGSTEGTNINTYTLSGSDWLGNGNTDDIPDVIFIRIGINDGTNVTLFTDDTDTVFSQSYSQLTRMGIASSLRWAIETLQCAYPKSSIFVASPLQVNSADSRLSYTNTKLKRDIIKKVCEFCSVYFIDSFAESGFSKRIARGYGSWDGVHQWEPWRTNIARFEANEIIRKYSERRLT